MTDFSGLSRTLVNSPGQPPDRRTYSEKLKDGRWLKRRNEVFREANYRCEECGTEHDLQTHHVLYLPGRDPWDYPLQLLMCLCGKCHKMRQEFEGRVFLNVATTIRDKSVRELRAMPVWTFFEGLEEK